MNLSLLLQFITDNSHIILALIGLYEGGANVIPTEKDMTIIGKVRGVLNTLKKLNRKKGGGDHS